MKRTLEYLTLAIVLSLTLSQHSSADDGELRELDDYIQYGLRHSASLQSAFEDYSAARFKAPQVTSLPDPQITYANQLRSVETRVGPQKHRLGISQPFPWFGTLSLRGDVADAETKAEFNRFLSLKNDLVYKIIKAYTERAYVDSAIAITKETIDLVKTWERILQERFRTAAGSHSDLVRVQVELGTLEDKLFEFEDLKTPLSVHLNSLLNRADHEDILVKERFLESFSNRAAGGIVFDEVLKHNPELLMLEAVEEAKVKGITLAEKKFYPDFRLGLDYIITGERDVVDGGDDAVIGMVSFNVPIGWQKNRAAVSEAQARKRSIAQMRKEKENRLRSELSRAQYSLRDSQRKISLYQNTLLPKTQESIEASYTAYEAGDTGFLDVIDSEQRLLEFQLALRRAQADNIIAATMLQKIAGQYNQLKSAQEAN